MAEDLYVIVEWIQKEAPFPRYSLATPKHAEELETNVNCVQTCGSLALAGQIVAQLNRQEATASHGGTLT
jgi:flagella basal body P-ring formation protein FlgA